MFESVLSSKRAGLPSTLDAGLQELLARLDRALPRGKLSPLDDSRPSEALSSAPKSVLFDLREMRYAVPLENVLELQRMPRVTPLPFVPDWLRGVANLRGDVLSVVDLRLLLGLPAAERLPSQRLLVVRSTCEEIATGWIVDRVIGIRGIAPEELQPSSSMTTGAAARFLTGFVEREGHPVAVLDVNRVLASPEMRQFESSWQAAVSNGAEQR